ncbi:MAG: hypothetical protein HPY74_15595 [Firmicutes bacterium]|nr:hypothetical protein [Bacillota bacterium]
MKRKLLSRILITLLGAALILWAAESLALGLFGERTTAVVTSIRREGGERADVLTNRYTYNISYTFILPDGKEMYGFTKEIGGAVYLKTNGTGRIAVRYFKIMPYINTPEGNSPFSLGPLILTGTGIFLIVQMNRKKS